MDKSELNFEEEIKKIINKLKEMDKKYEIIWLYEDIYEIISNIEHHVYIGEKDAESN